MYGFADYWEICKYVAMAAFDLSSQSYGPEIVYSKGDENFPPPVGTQ